MPMSFFSRSGIVRHPKHGQIVVKYRHVKLKPEGPKNNLSLPPTHHRLNAPSRRLSSHPSGRRRGLHSSSSSMPGLIEEHNKSHDFQASVIGEYLGYFGNNSDESENDHDKKRGRAAAPRLRQDLSPRRESVKDSDIYLECSDDLRNRKKQPQQWSGALEDMFQKPPLEEDADEQEDNDFFGIKSKQLHMTTFGTSSPSKNVQSNNLGGLSTNPPRKSSHKSKQKRHSTGTNAPPALTPMRRTHKTSHGKSDLSPKGGNRNSASHGSHAHPKLSRTQLYSTSHRHLHASAQGERSGSMERLGSRRKISEHNHGSYSPTRESHRHVNRSAATASEKRRTHSPNEQPGLLSTPGNRRRARLSKSLSPREQFGRAESLPVIDGSTAPRPRQGLGGKSTSDRFFRSATRGRHATLLDSKTTPIEESSPARRGPGSMNQRSRSLPKLRSGKSRRDIRLDKASHSNQRDKGHHKDEGAHGSSRHLKADHSSGQRREKYHKERSHRLEANSPSSRRLLGTEKSPSRRSFSRDLALRREESIARREKRRSRSSDPRRRRERPKARSIRQRSRSLSPPPTKSELHSLDRGEKVHIP